jgi:nucleoside phosphorylase
MPFVDVVILTALGEELRTFRDVIAMRAHACGTSQRDGIVADLYLLPSDDGELTICVASDFSMGGEKMAAFAARVFSNWKPSAAVLTGIAGLVDVKNYGLGDVAVADQVFSYANVAVTDGELLFRKSGYQVSAALRRAAGRLLADTAAYAAWQDAARTNIAPLVDSANVTRPKKQQIVAPLLEDPPVLFVETGAGGPFLVRDKEFRDDVVGKQIDAKVAWLEMEAHGFMHAAHQEDVRAIVAKGISDLSDSHKSKLETKSKGFWRLYASANAASAVLEMLRRSALARLSTNVFTVDLTLSNEHALRDGTFVKQPGFVNIGFPRLIVSLGPVFEASLQVRADDDSGQTVPPAKVTCTQTRVNRPPMRLEATPTANGLRIPLADAETPSVIAYAASYPRRIEAIEFTLTSSFRKPATFRWTANRRRPT